MKSPFKQTQLVVREDIENHDTACGPHSNLLPSDLVDCNICVEESIETSSSTTSESPIFEFSTILPPILGEYANNDTNYSDIERHPSYVLPPLSMVIKKRLTDITDQSNKVIKNTCAKELFELRDQSSLCTISSVNKQIECNIPNQEQICGSSIPIVSSPSSGMVHTSTVPLTPNNLVNKSLVDSCILVDNTLDNAPTLRSNPPTSPSVISQYNSTDNYVQAIKCLIFNEERAGLLNVHTQSLIEILLPKGDARMDSEVTNVSKKRDMLVHTDVDDSDTKTVEVEDEDANKDVHNIVILETDIGCTKMKNVDTHVELASDDFMTWFNSKNGLLVLPTKQNRTQDKESSIDSESTKDLEILIESDLKTSFVAPCTINSDHDNSEQLAVVIHDSNCSEELLSNHNGMKSEQSTGSKEIEMSVNSPLLFSDNEDSENYPCYNNILMAPKFGQQQEQCRLKQIQESLIGVIPPPSVTIPQLGVDEMLRLLRDNDSLLSLAQSTENIDYERSSALRQTAAECHWPGVKSCCYPDVHYNNGASSEEFEALCQKFTQRFVGCETASTCNLWAAGAGNSERRNCKRAAGPSPGRRLSHLARRRRAFSRDNLLGSLPAHTAMAERRQILVQNKKPGNTQEQKCKFPTRALTHKRALFQSPDDSMKKCPAPTSSSSSKRKVRSAKPNGDGPSFKRALFSSTCKEEGSKRRLVYPSDQASTSQRPSSSSSGNASALSSGHRKKLLWAVAEALRGSGIGMAHKLFRPCASALIRLCRAQLTPLLESRSGSTTEIMVQLAKRHAADIVKETQAALQ